MPLYLCEYNSITITLAASFKIKAYMQKEHYQRVGGLFMLRWHEHALPVLCEYGDPQFWGPRFP